MEGEKRATGLSFLNTLPELTRYVNYRTEQLVTDSSISFNFSTLSADVFRLLILFRLSPLFDAEKEQELLDEFTALVNIKRQEVNQTKSTVSQQTKDIYQLGSTTNPSAAEINVLKQKATKLIERATRTESEIIRLENENKILRANRLVCIEDTLNHEIGTKESQTNDHTQFDEYIKLEKEFQASLSGHQVLVSKAKAMNQKIHNEIESLEMQLSQYDSRISLMSGMVKKSGSTPTKTTLAERALIGKTPNEPNQKIQRSPRRSSQPIPKMGGDSDDSDYSSSDTDNNDEDKENNKLRPEKAFKRTRHEGYSTLGKSTPIHSVTKEAKPDKKLISGFSIKRRLSTYSNSSHCHDGPELSDDDSEKSEFKSDYSIEAVKSKSTDDEISDELEEEDSSDLSEPEDGQSKGRKKKLYPLRNAFNDGGSEEMKSNLSSKKSRISPLPTDDYNNRPNSSESQVHAVKASEDSDINDDEEKTDQQQMIPKKIREPNSERKGPFLPRRCSDPTFQAQQPGVIPPPMKMMYGTHKYQLPKGIGLSKIQNQYTQMKAELHPPLKRPSPINLPKFQPEPPSSQVSPQEAADEVVDLIRQFHNIVRRNRQSEPNEEIST